MFLINFILPVCAYILLGYSRTSELFMGKIVFMDMWFLAIHDETRLEHP